MNCRCRNSEGLRCRAPGRRWHVWSTCMGPSTVSTAAVSTPCFVVRHSSDNRGQQTIQEPGRPKENSDGQQDVESECQVCAGCSRRVGYLDGGSQGIRARVRPPLYFPLLGIHIPKYSILLRVCLRGPPIGMTCPSRRCRNNRRTVVPRASLYSKDTALKDTAWMHRSRGCPPVCLLGNTKG